MTTRRIIIIGGGVAGLTAAHELLDAGFAVDIYEHNALPGGKARSLEVPPTEFKPAEGKRPLPAEHGFRFFPGFYQHLDQTLRKIDSPATGSKVFASLVNVDFANFGRFGKPLVRMPTGFPDSVTELFELFAIWLSKHQIGMDFREVLLYASRIEELVTSCDRRIEEELEAVTWWQFVEAGKQSEKYQRFFAGGTRMLVAADPRKASARTNGTLLERMMRCQRENMADRILNGPTNQVWLFPWLKQLLASKRLRYFVNAKVTEIRADVQSRCVTHIVVEHRDPEKARFSAVTACDHRDGPVLQEVNLPDAPITGDAYIAAVPAEVMARYVVSNNAPTPPHVGDIRHWSDIAKIDARLRALWELGTEHVEWMNGAIFYLTGTVKPVPGHTMLVDSPYALTSILQGQHWDRRLYPLDSFGRGDLAEICSVDISNWRDTQTCPGGPAICDIPNGGRGRINDLSASETFQRFGSNGVFNEVLTDLRASLQAQIGSATVLHGFLDPAIALDANGKTINSEPLLVNRANGLTLRPQSRTKVINLFLAADYVRTNTDLACMEAANEAAKAAVNGILDHFESDAPRCQILLRQRLESPELRLLRELDCADMDKARRNRARVRYESMMNAMALAGG